MTIQFAFCSFKIVPYIFLIQMQQQQVTRRCYTQLEEPLNTHHPGTKTNLPSYILAQFCELFPSYKKKKMFFGGHPVSITKQSYNQIFTLPPTKVSPYLVCQKSDGVRYLLVIAKVAKSHLLRSSKQQAPLQTQCYFISRGGQNSLQSFVVDVGVSFDMTFSTSETVKSGMRHIVQILDGELVLQKHRGKEYLKFLIFDALVHLGRNICSLTLKERLQCCDQFIKCNEMLGVQPSLIPIELKDFFRLTNRKFNVIDFLLNKYIKMIEHQNDGLIFNHEEKPYALGTTNPGYIKWKPEHLNTVDFMIVPNHNMQQKFGKKVLDLYVACQDAQLDRYTRQFYAFTVINQRDFDDIQEMLDRKQEERFNMAQQNEDFTIINQFSGAIIAECRFDRSDRLQERQILRQLSKEPVEELMSNLMKPSSEEDKDQNSLKEMRNKIYDKNWHIYKVREDKALPNNIEVVKRIEQSIRDGIKSDDLLRQGKAIHEQGLRL